MRLHVFFTVDQGLESLLAVGTHEGPHVAVCGHVALQTAARGEHGVTHQAAVRLLPRVCPHVGLQHSARHKAPQAQVAPEWPLPCGGINMSFS